MTQCPRDGNTLVKHTGDTLVTWHCNICTGTFIKALPTHDFQSSGKMPSREEWDVEVFCPEDSKKMASLTINGVTIDICSKCGGIWLDGGEMDILLGPDFSRQMASDHPSSKPSGGGLSEADVISPLINAALSALFHV